MPAAFSLTTDVNPSADAPPVKVEVIAPGGDVLYSTSAKRGEQLFIDGKAWPTVPTKSAAARRTRRGLLYVTHLTWYKGDARQGARAAATAAKADASMPEGHAVMLATMVEDRLGTKVADAKAIPDRHSLAAHGIRRVMLERAGSPARIRANGFVRMAWIDEIDGSANTLGPIRPPTKTREEVPMVIQLHGFNPPNPPYWRWWGVDSRH
jgi:hypothetical protein